MDPVFVLIPVAAAVAVLRTRRQVMSGRQAGWYSIVASAIAGLGALGLATGLFLLRKDALQMNIPEADVALRLLWLTSALAVLLGATAAYGLIVGVRQYRKAEAVYGFHGFKVDEIAAIIEEALREENVEYTGEENKDGRGYAFDGGGLAVRKRITGCEVSAAAADGRHEALLKRVVVAAVKKQVEAGVSTTVRL
ncbi:MAG: hypothetical protein JW909_04150 [Planctomycetes bacterium]|nr:hypothetical protein [Planctomycetota bacterium]